MAIRSTYILILSACLLSFQQAFCQSVHKPKKLSKFEMMQKYWEEKNSQNWCGYRAPAVIAREDSLYKTRRANPFQREIVELHCGTVDFIRGEPNDTIYIDSLKVQTKYDVPPYLKDDLKLLHHVISYPKKEKEVYSEGTCLAFLRISTKGIVDSVWIATAPTANFEKITRDAVKSLPKFVPAKYKGKPIEAIGFYKVRFRIF